MANYKGKEDFDVVFLHPSCPLVYLRINGIFPLLRTEMFDSNSDKRHLVVLYNNCLVQINIKHKYFVM